jgi:hypothetical protein
MTSKPYLRPAWPARVIGGRLARLFKPRVVALLSVPGRSTGTWHSTAVAVLEHDGAPTWPSSGRCPAWPPRSPPCPTPPTIPPSGSP